MLFIIQWIVGPHIYFWTGSGWTWHRAEADQFISRSDAETVIRTYHLDGDTKGPVTVEMYAP